MATPRKEEIPGLVDVATISSGFTMHVPQRARRHWNLKVGDKLEFYSPFVDFPASLSEEYKLIAVVVRRKDEQEAKL